MNKQRSRVFVVDDDRSVRTSLANLLESDDYTVETFASASEYLSQPPLVGPSCLVLDVRLPGLDGLALQRQLLEGGRTEQIVFITGFGDIPMGIQAMKRGAIDFLPKPFDDGALLSAVRQAFVRSAESWQKREEMAQIAAELGAALRTIKTHRGRVMHKMGVASVAELVRLAQTAGVVPAPVGP
jgi:FixJ family two-component response regulator